MITTTKKQSSLVLVVVAFATIMMAGSIAGNAFAGNQNDFKRSDRSDHFNHFDHFSHFNHFDHFSHFNHSHHHGKTSHIDQNIGQACSQDASSVGSTSGLLGAVVASGNNIPVCVNANLAGNVAAADQSGH
jgi:hypothetical protein